MTFWINLHRLTSRAFHAKYEKIYDEERLETESGPRRRQRRTNQRVTLPSRTTVFLFLVNLVIVGLLLFALEPLITLLRRNKELFSPGMTLPSSSISYDRNRIARLSHIPLILHQTTAKETIPDPWVRSQKSCKQAYSDFEYKVYLSICDCESFHHATATHHDIRTPFFGMSLTVLASCGLMPQLGISLPTTTHGSWILGTTTLSLSSGPTRSVILFCITMVVYTSTWIHGATKLCPFTNSDQAQQKTMPFSNPPFQRVSPMTSWLPLQTIPLTQRRLPSYLFSMRSPESGPGCSHIALL